MPNEEDEERLLRSVALENAKSILFARQRAERALLEANEALELKTQELSEANRRLSESEALYRSALSAGRMGTWETDLVARTRQWTPEGMALFGINLPDGRGHVGGDQDEYWSALHPDDRHLVQKVSRACRQAGLIYGRIQGGMAGWHDPLASRPRSGCFPDSRRKGSPTGQSCRRRNPAQSGGRPHKIPDARDIAPLEESAHRDPVDCSPNGPHRRDNEGLRKPVRAAAAGSCCVARRPGS